MRRFLAGDVTIGGGIAPDGSHFGGYDVDHPADGKYIVSFDKPFHRRPVVVATSDGGQRGAWAEVSSVTNRSFVVEGRAYNDHGLADIAFSFIAISQEPG